MDTRTLFNALRAIRKRCKRLKYIHVTAADECHLVNFTRDSTVIIMNTKERSHVGEHWLLFIKHKKHGFPLIYFFDSMGQSLKSYNILTEHSIKHINFQRLQCLSTISVSVLLLRHYYHYSFLGAVDIMIHSCIDSSSNLYLDSELSISTLPQKLYTPLRQQDFCYSTVLTTPTEFLLKVIA